MAINEPCFEPQSYSEFRPLYPGELFAQVVAWADSRPKGSPWRILDIGCGTGQSTESLLRALGDRASKGEREVVSIDMDWEMLMAARDRYAQLDVKWRQGTGEDTGCADVSVDLLSVGSAYHWMQPEICSREWARILAPDGLACIYEYQFPKVQGAPELNEWIRREFNTKWRAPEQVPRGTLKELIEDLGEGWRISPPKKMREVQKLSVDEFFGHLISQSRVRHYITRIGGHAYQAELRTELERIGPRDQTWSAEFIFEAFCLVRSS